MPPLSRWYIRTSLLYLLGSLLVGLAVAFQSTLSLSSIVAALAPVYFHLFLVGWILQLIFGVIFWLFPKPRNDEVNWDRLGWIAWGLLNSGLLLRAIAEPRSVFAPGSVWGWALVLSAVMQWFAGIGLIIMVWPRTYSRQRKPR